jgi:hypothetical protein
MAILSLLSWQLPVTTKKKKKKEKEISLVRTASPELERELDIFHT